jgi:hypothetical protein
MKDEAFCNHSCGALMFAEIPIWADARREIIRGRASRMGRINLVLVDGLLSMVLASCDCGLVLFNSRLYVLGGSQMKGVPNRVSAK